MSPALPSLTTLPKSPCLGLNESLWVIGKAVFENSHYFIDPTLDFAELRLSDFRSDVLLHF